LFLFYFQVDVVGLPTHVVIDTFVYRLRKHQLTTCLIPKCSTNVKTYVEASYLRMLCCLLKLSDLPVEMLEMVLMRSFMMLHSRNFQTDDCRSRCKFRSSDGDRRQYMLGLSKRAEQRAFILLASVCSSWHFTLTGWPESPTPLWVKHQLQKLITSGFHCIVVKIERDIG